MPNAAPEAVLITRDPSLAGLAAEVLRATEVDWHRTFTSGLTGITRETDVLIIDAAAGVPMAHLLAALFLDQRSGRRALVIQPADAPMRANADPRVAIVDRPLTAGALSRALGEAAEFGRRCEAIESLARLGRAVAECATA